MATPGARQEERARRDSWIGIRFPDESSRRLDRYKILLDEIGIELVPVLLGVGTKLIADPALPPMELDGPILVVEGTGVTHLRYRVIR